MTYLKKLKTNVFDAYVTHMMEENVLGRKDEYLHLPKFEVAKDQTFTKVEKVLLDTYKKAGYDFVRFSEINLGNVERETAEDIVLVMMDEGSIVRVNEEMFTLSELMEEAKERIREYLKVDPLITIAQVRDMFGTSRKSAKPILEYMDGQKITKKNGAESERVSFL